MIVNKYCYDPETRTTTPLIKESFDNGFDVDDWPVSETMPIWADMISEDEVALGEMDYLGKRVYSRRIKYKSQGKEINRKWVGKEKFV